VDEKKLLALLKRTGYPVAYSHFSSPQKPPYIAYIHDDPDNFGADDKVYNSAANFIIELYTAKHDPAAQAGLERIFDDNSIYWERIETWIESEKLFQTAYYV
jgi:hypothetical protein